MHTRFTASLCALLPLTACVPAGLDDDDAGSTPATTHATEGDTDASAGSESEAGSESATTGDTADASSSDSGDSSDTTGTEPGAPIVLVDCAAEENSEEPKCDNEPAAGSIGAGPPMYKGYYSKIYAAVVDGSTLLVTVDMISIGDEFGGVMRVDLHSGDRTWIAGNYRYDNDPEVTMRGAGGEIGDVRGLARLSDGRIVIHRESASDSGDAFLELDVETGDRTDFLLADESDKYPCGEVTVSVVDVATLAPGVEGDFYVSGHLQSDTAVLRFLSDGQCQIVSRSGDPDGGDVGTGDPFGNAQLEALEYYDGQLYALTDVGGRELFRVDPATGDRTLLSSESAGVGLGPSLGGDSLDVTAEKIWTAGYTLDLLPIVSVDPATGDRTDEAPEPIAGPLDSGASDDHPQIFVYGDQILFETAEGGIGVYDPETKNSNWISM